jgi:DNA-binding LacI/PurR family transcriptional regulator/DNA-binding transcriptional regulator YhcF (GntR family)
MIRHGPHTPKILQLAARIEEDIRTRMLRPGDAYLGTQEVARMLGVSTVAANRAMQLLVQRRLLLRRQRSGAVIAEAALDSQRSRLRCVHFLVHRDYLKTEGLLADGVMIGMQAELPGVDVQMNFLPPVDSEESVTRRIAATLRASEPEGFVLVRASLAVQRLLQASGLPTVVHGSLYPSVHGLAWLDRDHRQSARLLTQHLLERDCQRVLYLSRDQLFPGDYPFLDGICETLAEAGRPLSALRIRHLPSDHAAIQAAVSELLGPQERGLGIIARTECLAEGAAAAIRAAGRETGSDVAVVISQVYRSGSEKPVAFPHTRNTWEPQKIGLRLGRMLVRLAGNQPLEPDHEVIPVELYDSARKASG